MISIEDQIILITGSTSGLGRLTAIDLAKAGAEVILHGKDEEKIKKVAGEIEKLNPKHKTSYIVCNFNYPKNIEKAFGKIDQIDILINNAGVWSEGDTIGISPTRIIEMVNVNLNSYLIASRVLLPKLLKSKYSQILNVVSIAGVEIPFDYYHTIYTATKYALQGFSEAMEKEFTDKNLRIMGFYPGGMSTELFKNAGVDYKENEDWMFDPIESVEAMKFMLTRNKKVNIKRLDLVNHLSI